MMSSGQDFYATRSDLEKGFKAIESKRQLKYVQLGWQRSPTFDVYQSALDIPELGIEHSSEVVTSRKFLVLHNEAEITVRKLPQQDGTIYYAVSYLDHRDAMVFQPGGLYQDICLLPGHIHTSRQREISNALYRVFRRVLLKDFIRMEEGMIGPEALHLAENGVRLITMYVDEDRAVDAQPPKQS